MLLKRTVGAVAAAMITAGCLIPSASAAVVPTLVSSEMTDSLTTSHDPGNYLTFTLDGTAISCECILTRDGLNQIMFRLQDADGRLIGEKLSFDISSGVPFSASADLASIPDLPDEFFVEVYTSATQDRSDELWNNHGRSVLVSRTDGKYAFCMSPAMQSNSEQLDAWINPGSALDAPVSESIKAVSDGICLGITDDYEKIRAIYTYVAENIYYDCDFAYGKSESTANLADDVLNQKRAMPSGFCNLLEALIEAQGIPAVITKGHTTDMTELMAGASSRYINYTVEALADGRWIIMLPYRETVGKYENGEYSPWIKRAYRGFDLTPEFFATFFKVTERSTALPEDAPSDWAREEISLAISEGLVDAGLQGGYRNTVTRGELDTLILHMLSKKTGASDASGIAEALSAESLPFGDRDGQVQSDEICRSEAAEAFWSAALLLGAEVTAGASYTDLEGVEPAKAEAINGVSGIYTDGARAVMGGITEGVFAPDAPLTREQAVIILYRLYLAL